MIIDLQDSIIKKLSEKFLLPVLKKIINQNISVEKKAVLILQAFFLLLTTQHLLWASIGKGWRYPETGDDQRSCPMLDAMFHIEKREGVIIFLPTKNRGEADNSEAEIRKVHTL